MNEKRVYIVQIGTGGTGAAFTQMAAQAISTLADSNSVYVLADPDILEAKNLRNQPFIEADINRYKAEVLAERYEHAYGLHILPYTESYLESVEAIERLFMYNGKNVLKSGGFHCILIGCCDNNFTRKIMHEFFLKHDSILYIDSGNEGCILPKNKSLQNRMFWSKEEEETYENSGYSGQVVIGHKIRGEVRTPPLCEVFPDVLEDDDEIAPSELSCTVLAASEPQRYITNRFAATALLSALQTYLIQSAYTYDMHIIHFHALKCYMRSMSYDSSI